MMNVTHQKINIFNHVKTHQNETTNPFSIRSIYDNRSSNGVR